MGVTVAEGVVEVTADATHVGRDIGREISRDQSHFSRAGDDSAKTFGSVFKGSFFGNFLGNIATDIVGSIGNAIGSGIRGAIEFGMGGIEIASGLQEAGTAIDSIFGPGGAADIQAWGKTTGRTLGQSRLAALKASQTFGVYGQAAGLAGEANADFSQELVKTASDFASFYDTSPEDAILAIGSALRGEFEPLRSYGIMLDDAALKQQAMNLGIYDGEGALTAQQKVLAANSLIVADTNASYNDFSETSGGLANQQRTLAAELENAQGKLGEAMLPAMLGLTTWANDNLVPMLDDVIEKVGPALGEALETAGPAFTTMMEDIAPHLPTLATFAADTLPILIDGFTWLIDELVETGEEFDTAKTRMEPFFAFMGDEITEANENFGTLGETIQAELDETAGEFEGLGTRIGEAVTTVGTELGNFDADARASRDNAVTVFGEIGTELGNFDRDTRTSVQNAGSHFNTFTADVNRNMSNAGREVGNFGADVGRNFANGGAAVGRFADDVNRNIGLAIAWIQGIPGRAMVALGDLGNTLLNSGKALINGFRRGVEREFESLKTSVENSLAWVAGLFPSSPAKHGPFSGSGWTRIERGGGAVMDAFASGFGPRPEIAASLGGIAGAFGADGFGSPRTVAGPTAGAAAGGSGGGIGSPTVHLEQKIYATDPILGARQAAREVNRYLGV